MGREGAEPFQRAVTPGRSVIFSAKLIPGLLSNSTSDFDSTDWYCSSAGRAAGDPETTISLSGMADGVRSNEADTTPPVARTVSVAAR